MYKYGKTSANAQGRSSVAYLLGLLVVLGFVVSTVMGSANLGQFDAAGLLHKATRASASRFDPSRFILNALLAPALDGDADPLRWVDPRPALRCGPGATVRVDGSPLTPGTLVPDTPFELEWHAEACRPFGAAGPRFDGKVRLTVFREDWGFTALVKPHGLRITTPWHPLTYVARGTASMPQSAPDDELFP